MYFREVQREEFPKMPPMPSEPVEQPDNEDWADVDEDDTYERPEIIKPC